MIRSYLTLALRTLAKQKLYAFVNIIGLAVGLACAILILLYVQYELGYDRFHEQADRIYRVVQRQPGNNYLGNDTYAVTPAPMPAALMRDFPEVAYATSVNDSRALLSLDDRHYYEEGLWVSDHFLDIFSFPLLQGDPSTALAEPNTIALTRSLARKIFGDDDPVGQTLRYQNDEIYTVTGVVADPPDDSHLAFSFLASLRSEENYMTNLEDDSWSNSSWYTYFLLHEGQDVKALQAKLPAFLDRYRPPDEDDDPLERQQLVIQALTDIHLRSHINFEISANNDIAYILLFGAIAAVILLLACVNYTNLAVARSIKRAREVGMRKVVGAHRGQLVRQFVGESVLLAFLALVVALLLVHLLLPVFSRLVERSLTLDYLGNPWLVPGLAGLALAVGILSGSYPAFFMAALRPIHVLKGTADRRSGRSMLRSLLVVAQFAASIILVVGSLVIYQQLQYIQHKELGYEREHIVTLPMRDRSLRDRSEAVKQELEQHPGVVAVTITAHLPTRISSQTTVSGWEGSSEDDSLPIYQTNADEDFLEVFGIELVAGRFFSSDFPGDTSGAFVLNETAVRALGWTPETAVGKQFKRWRTEGPVVGVVKDFHMHSFHLPIQPLMIQPEAWMSHIAVRVRPDDLPGTLAHLEATMGRFTPFPFEFEFLDEAFDELYRTEIRLGETFGYFTILAMLIAALGLFGLAAFAAEQRTKEIGVRKVLGASVGSLVLLLSREFARLVAVAFVIAVPVAYLVMNRWLEDFAYRVDISWRIFLMAGVAALGVALLTVSYQSIKAARVSPVQSLQYE